jgi:hypothetical protein
MKIVITHLIKKKEQLEEKLAKNAPLAKPTPLASKPPTSSKPITTKTTTLSSPIPKKPSSIKPTNIIYNLIKHPKEVLILKSPSYIKFNQIQIEQIEIEIFNIPTPRQKNNIQKEIIEINNLVINTSSLRANEIKITFPTLKPLLQTEFTTSEPLLKALPAKLY